MNQEFIPLLFGGDINVYSVARAFHEAYGVRSICYGKFSSGPAYQSAIIDYRTSPQNEEPDTFVQNVQMVAAAHFDKPVVLVACGDSYVKLAAQCRDQLPKNVIVPYASLEQIERLTNKESFYRLCEAHGIAYPDTFVYRREMGEEFDLPFEAPYIVKPSNGVAYWAHPFEGNDKVFKCADREALQAVLEKVYASGYEDSMIIQDFIPGDDSYMRVLTNYSDRHGKVLLMCLGHVLLEEHTPHGLGNHAVILTESNTEENEALCEKLRGFLEAIEFRGFSNFDIKYDQRDNQFKVFEINCRQGRSNYYVTGSGYNIAKYLVEDFIEDREKTFVIAARPSLWRVVPRKVAYDYVPATYHKKMRRQKRQKRDRNPLFYKADKNPLRFLRNLKNQLGQFSKFKQYYERKS